VCELLLRIVDKCGTRLNDTISMAGDVITIQRDGWPWGRLEVTNLEWRIWRMPDIDANALLDLLEVDNSRIGGSSFYQRYRVRYLDLSGPFARALIWAGQFIELSSDETRKVLALKRTKNVLGMVG
jgi:hypothetical protein